MTPSTRLRAITAEDEPFLRQLYASTRESELAPLDWSEEQKQAFLAMQFVAQHTYYQQQFADARFDVIERAGQPIGRLYVDRRQNEIRIIDIALVPEFRNQGVGSYYLRQIQAEGRQRGLPVRIHVEANNPAMGLYQRLGFRQIDTYGAYWLMEWKA